VSLDLSYNLLAGVPAEIGNLTALEDLNLNTLHYASTTEANIPDMFG